MHDRRAIGDANLRLKRFGLAGACFVQGLELCRVEGLTLHDVYQTVGRMLFNPSMSFVCNRVMENGECPLVDTAELTTSSYPSRMI